MRSIVRLPKGQLSLGWALLGALLCVLASSASAGESVLLVDRDAALPEGTAFQARPLGTRTVWIPAPGDPSDRLAQGRRVEAEDGETLYVVEEHAVPADPAGLRTLAAWEGYRIVAVRDPSALEGMSHSFERLRWITPPPRRDGFALPLDRRAPAEARTELIDAIDSARYTQILRVLSGDLPDRNVPTIVTRATSSTGMTGGIDDAIDYLVSGFETAGYAVLEQTFAAPGATARNLVAIREGQSTPNEVVVVGAHYDSTSEIPTILAPGAEDNASGASAVLHLAEVFAGFEVERSVHFVCFGAEEQGLYGSQHYVDQLASNGWTVVGALTMDMIAAWVDDFGVLIESNLASRPLMELFETNVIELGVLSEVFSFNPFGSDHIPFLQAGLPALLAIDLDWAAYADFHQSTDTFSQTDPALGYEITRAIAGTVVDLAGPVTPVVVADGTSPGAERGLRLQLDPPRPNPFNPRTQIGFEIESPGHVTLRVYDARGRIIRTLVDEARPAGRDAEIWNGQDDDASDVASGMYFVRLAHEADVRTRRLVLVR